MTHRSYTAESVLNQNELTDIRIHINDKIWHLWGRNGTDREAMLAANTPDGTLPVMLGAGLGHCLEKIASRNTPVAVIDKERPIYSASGTEKKFRHWDNVLWITEESAQAALDALLHWQAQNGGKPFHPIPIPIYLRLDHSHYGALATAITPDTTVDFWEKARFPKFQSSTPRVLFFDSSYFLCGEIQATFNRLGYEYISLEIDKGGIGNAQFIERLLKTVIDFRPDFVLTVNHFGLDREGKLSALLEKLQLPLASWFVDNPHLILHHYEQPGCANTVLFTYDAGNLALLKDKGFENVHYLPLATDPERFKPKRQSTIPKEWISDVSFVGNSMTAPVARSLRDAGLSSPWDQQYVQLAAQFNDSAHTSVMEFIGSHHPQWQEMHAALPTREHQLALESLITWEATRQYRQSCIREILPFTPLIVGDEGWKKLLPAKGWRHLPRLDYYVDLPHFYPCAKINFNCTSTQMKGAVNQRVFDVPACGGFILTDYRNQMEDLFDMDTEIIVFHSRDEIPEQIQRLLSDKQKRNKVIQAARRRILSQHTYEIRLGQLANLMRQTFS